MSTATESLKNALQYNASQQTFVISSRVEHLQNLHTALQTAFGGDDILVSRAQELENQGTLPPGTERLTLQGVASCFGYSRRDLYIEFGLKDGHLVNMLLLIPLPSPWDLTLGFSQLSNDSLPGGGMLNDATIVISYGFAAFNESRSFREHDKSTDTTIDLTGYPLQQGFQIIAHAAADTHEYVDSSLRSQASLVGLPEQILPPLNTDPVRIEIRSNVAEKWLDFERWWSFTPPADPDIQTILATGLAVRFNLETAQISTHKWLQELGSPEKPFVVEAEIIRKNNEARQRSDFYPVRYSSRFGVRTELGAVSNALHAIMGDRKNIFDQLSLTLPEIIALKGFSYSPGEWIQFTFAAGNFKDSESYLIEFGPISLLEVDFKVFWRVGNAIETTSVELNGWAEFFGERFHVHVDPEKLIEGGLEDLDGLQVGQLIEQAMPGISLPFGLDTISLTEAWITHRLEMGTTPSNTNLRLRFDGQVDLVPGTIELDTVEISISQSGSSFDEVSLKTIFQIGPIRLFAYVRYESENWVFSGTVREDGEGLSLHALVNYLGSNFSASLPEAVPDIHLSTYSLSYHTASGELHMQALVQMNVPNEIPVLGGSDTQAMLGLSMLRNPNNGNKEFAIDLDWTLDKNGNRLEANAHYTTGHQIFSFDFQVPNAATPITLSQLITELDLPDIPKPAAGVMDEIFQLSSFSFDYDSINSSYSTAWSRPLGTAGGLLLAEYTQSTDESTGTQREVDVKWIPLAANETFGIENLLGWFDLRDEWTTLTGFIDTLGGNALIEIFTELFTFKQLGLTWKENPDTNSIMVTALSQFPQGNAVNPRGNTARSNGTKAFIKVTTGSQEGIVAGISLIEEPFSPNPENLADHVPVSTMPLPLTFLPDEVAEIATDIIDAAQTILDHVTLTHLQVSTYNSRTYRPPTYDPGKLQPAYAQQGLPITRPFGNNPMPLIEGVSLGIRVNIGDNEMIRKVIDFDELDGSLTLGETPTIQVSIPQTLKIDAGIGRLTLGSPVLQLKAGAMGVEVDLMSSIDMMLFGQHLSIVGWLSLSPEAILGHIELDEIPFNFPVVYPAMPGVIFEISPEHPLFFDMGLQLEPPGLDIGMSGRFGIYKNKDEKVYGDVTFVLEIEEEFAVPLFIEFGLDEMSIPVLLEARTGLQYGLHQRVEGLRIAQQAAETVAADGPEVLHGAAENLADGAGLAADAIEEFQNAIGHIEAILSEVEFRAVRIRWADSIVNLPDGSTAMPGISVRGELSVFDWDAYMFLDLSAQGMPGLSGHFQTEKIELDGILKIWGDGQGIHTPPSTAEDINVQVRANIDTLRNGETQANNALAPEDEGSWFLEPGGPVLHLSTRAAPFLHADLHAELLGFMHADIHADITKEGFSFDFQISSDEVATGWPDRNSEPRRSILCLLGSTRKAHPGGARNRHARQVCGSLLRCRKPQGA